MNTPLDQYLGREAESFNRKHKEDAIKSILTKIDEMQSKQKTLPNRKKEKKPVATD